MNIENEVVLSYLNSCITEAEIENAAQHGLDLTIVKFDIVEREPIKYKEVIKFIYKYCDFMPIVADNYKNFVIYLRNIKLHTTVLMMKNLNMALKINQNTVIKNIAITNFDESDTLETILKRVNDFYIKSKLSGNNMFYGTKYLNLQNEDNENILKEVFEKDNTLYVYGLYQEAAVKIDAEILSTDGNITILKVPKSFLSFLQKQPILYAEHRKIPDVFETRIINIDYLDSTIEVGKFNFTDNSPLHRKNARVSPSRPIKATLTFSDFVIYGLISDISVSSVLFTTEIQNVEEIEKLKLLNKTFKLDFRIENLYGNNFDINVKATIYKTIGNQFVLNIFTNADNQKIIREYVNSCYQELLLHVQGKVVK